MVAEGDTPSVTGISPAEGPPGTIVKIRGENLGINAKDVIGIFICNINCTYTAEWQHSRLIHCRTGMGMGIGDIIVFTKSGGKGTCLVKFRGFMPRVGLLTEAAVWVDESKLFEEKPTTLSNPHAYTTNTVHTDPLGVAPEETGAVLSADKMEEWYPGLSSNPLSENFHPARFLLERHLDTSFEALKSGYYHLQSKDTRTSVGPSSFVRGNLTTILEALQTLVEVQRVMTADNRASPGDNICAELQGVVGSCDVASNSLFKDILARKDEADAKRNVLNILHRFRFLFNLQRSIEKNIQQGEYEILISDYNRAKALFQNTQVKSFQKALAEVDKKVATFSQNLKHKLFDFPTPIEEQKKIIRYLNDLDYPGNAGLECINKQALWIKSMLLDCQLEHQNHEKASQSEIRPSESSIKSHKKNSSDVTELFLKNSRNQLPECLKRIHSVSTYEAPHTILMVEELCELTSRHVSDFWNLGQAYLSNQLGEKVKNVEKSKLEKEKFQETVKDVIIVFCEMVYSVLLPDNDLEANGKVFKFVLLIPWLPSTLQAVKSTLDRLTKLGLTSDIITPLNNLTSTLISECIRKILSIAIQDINELYKRELWDLDSSEECYGTSKLASMFEKISTETLQFVHEFMIDTKIEGDNNMLPKEISALLKKMFEGYILSLEKSVYPDLNNSEEQLCIQTPDGSDSMKKLSKDMQLLVVLSNCEHSKMLMLPRVLSLCLKYGHVEMEHLREEIMIAIDKLDERVFNAYIESKSNTLINAIEEGMFVSEFSYDGLLPVTGVRHYIKDIIMKLITVHYEVSTISSIFVQRVFNILIEKVCSEVKRVFLTVKKFSEYGSILGNLELNAIKIVFGNYINQFAGNCIEKAIQVVPTIESAKSQIDSLLYKFKASMHYQISIFGSPEDSTSSEAYAVPNTRRISVGARSRVLSAGERSLANVKQKKIINSRASPLSTSEAADNKAKPLFMKTDLQSISSTTEAESSSVTNDESASSSLSKKTKRQAPAPPSILVDDKKVLTKSKSSSNPFTNSLNPFSDDSGNPFIDDIESSNSQISTNPFFSDD
ncbi:exocyst complex component 2 isoform X2 [Hydra vulgaris]|uniref:exocyst complex component 2 isoform X2 n=1 Tax=Hydra vulgaris TaxID=6087 RepID=UPI0032E9E4CA